MVLGAAHGDELGYLFKMPTTPADLPKDSFEIKAVETMVELWTNFAKTSDPNPMESLSKDGTEMKSVGAMIKLWTNLGKTSDANSIKNVVWKSISKQEINVLNIGKYLTSSINPDQSRMVFWDSILDETRENLS